jgi:hypothetical protein
VAQIGGGEEQKSNRGEMKQDNVRVCEAEVAQRKTRQIQQPTGGVIKEHRQLLASQEQRKRHSNVVRSKPFGGVAKEDLPAPRRAKRLLIVLPAAGNRNTSGAVTNQGTNGNYWSATPNSTNAYNLNFNSTNVNPANNNNRSNGRAVRCVRPEFVSCFSPSIVTRRL